MRHPFRPEAFQGRYGRKRYFEGWYFKFAFPSHSFAVIPGVSLSADDPHAFVQVIRSDVRAAGYTRYPVSEFSAQTKPFVLRVGPNQFSLECVEVHLPGLDATLELDGVVRWPASALSPNSMGWYAFWPFMECSHLVLVLDATAEGVVNGRNVRGRIYVEKDFGRSFPDAWVWFQSNSFESRGLSVTCSIGRVPLLGRGFRGVMAGVLLDGTVHRWTTYTGARVEELVAHEGGVELCLSRGTDASQRLELRVDKAAGSELRSPIFGRMDGRIEETLDAQVELRLSTAGTTIFKGTGRHTGFEAHRPEVL